MKMNLNRISDFQSSKKLQDPIFKMPKSVQESIPISRIHKSGVFELEANKREKLYDKVYLFSDINYSDRDEDEKESILLQVCEMLNMFQTSFKIQIANFPQTKEFKDQLFIKTECREGYEKKLAEAYNAVFKTQMEEGTNNLTTVRFLILTVERECFEDAIAYFNSIEAEVEEHFQQMSSGVIGLTAEERLKYLYYTYNLDCIDDFSLSWTGLHGVDWKNDICSNCMLPTKRTLEFENYFASTLYIRNFPNSVKDKFLRNLISIPTASIITIDSSPISRDIALQELQKISMGIEDSIQKQQLERNKIGAYTSDISYKKRKEKKEIEKYLSDMGDRDANLFFTQILITVFGKTKEELEKNIRTVQSECKTNQFGTKICANQQLEAFQTVLPTGGRYVDYMRPLFTQPLAGFVFFNAREVMQARGKIYGYNRISKKMISGNRKTLLNGNGMILALPGSGKSVQAKFEMGQVYLMEPDDGMIIVDPQQEYSDIVCKWKGQYINLSPEAETYINPFELPKDQSINYGQFVSGIVELTITMIETIMEGAFTQYHKSIAERAVRLMYQEEKCIKNWESPTMYDFKRILENQTGRYQMFAEDILIIVMERFLKGSLSIFTHPTNVELHSRVIGFGLKNLPKNMKRTAMLIMLKFIENRVQENFAKGVATWIWCDEFHVMTSMPNLQVEIEEIFKVYRKFGGIPTGITQNIADLLRTKETRTMVANCQYLCLLKAEPIDQMDLKNALKLTAAQLKYITNNPVGTGLLKFGDNIVPFDNRMSKSSMLYQLYNTNIHEKAREKKLGNAQ